MENKFPPEFMNVMRRLLQMCAEENTDTVVLEFETSNGAKWSVEMTFSVEGDEDDG